MASSTNKVMRKDLKRFKNKELNYYRIGDVGHDDP
jgi:hypothetical protein